MIFIHIFSQIVTHLCVLKSFFFFFFGANFIILCRTTFSEFASKHAKDPRFKAIDKMKDREAMFTEFMTAFRKREKEDSKNKGDKVSRTRI